jgi:hypothetical protein
MTIERALSLFLTVVLLLVGAPSVASAYVDPTSGGLLLQLLLAGLAGLAVLIKMLWHRFKAFFTRNRKPGEESGG